MKDTINIKYLLLYIKHNMYYSDNSKCYNRNIEIDV